MILNSLYVHVEENMSYFMLLKCNVYYNSISFIFNCNPYINKYIYI